MKLLIDTTDREKIRLAIIQDKIQEFVFLCSHQSEKLLINIEEIFKKEHYNKEDLEAILVNIDPGSYTGVRVGVTTANALAWSLNIPVYAFENGSLNKALSIKPTNKFMGIVIPKYN